jgi:GxxExxY protein
MGLDDSGASIQPEAGSEKMPVATSEASDEWSREVIKAAIEVHRHLGRGLLKSAYEEFLCYELSLAGLPFRRKEPIVVRYRDIELPKAVEIDIIVACELPLMIVSAAEISPLLQSRLIARLRNGGWKHGLLINFSEKTLGRGVRRLVNPDPKWN